MYKIYPYIFLLFHYSYFYYIACLQNEILKYSYATTFWPKLEGAETFSLDLQYSFQRAFSMKPRWQAADCWLGVIAIVWALCWRQCVPHCESHTVMGLSWSLLCLRGAGGSAWPTEEYQALNILVYSSGSHPCAKYFNSRFYWLDLLLRPKLDSIAWSYWIKMFTSCNFRHGWKSSKSFIRTQSYVNSCYSLTIFLYLTTPATAVTEM